MKKFVILLTIAGAMIVAGVAAITIHNHTTHTPLASITEAAANPTPGQLDIRNATSRHTPGHELLDLDFRVHITDTSAVPLMAWTNPNRTAEYLIILLTRGSTQLQRTNNGTATVNTLMAVGFGDGQFHHLSVDISGLTMAVTIDGTTATATL